MWAKSLSDPGAEATVVRKHTSPKSYWVKVRIDKMRRRKHLRLLELEKSSVTREMKALPADTSAEKCGTDPVDKEDYAGSLGLAEQTVMARSGRYSKWPQYPDYRY